MPQVQPVKIMMVDDHVSIRGGLRLLLESHENFKVVGEATRQRPG
jgi:DNA-binding NarL/FixJ family response regulator